MRIALMLVVFLISSTLATPQAQPGSSTSPVYRAGGDVKPPRVIDAPEPKLTEEEKKQNHDAKFKGSAILLIVVGEDGVVRDAQVTRSLGSYLDGKALEEVKHWKFEPGTKKGKPVPVQISVEINFHLH